MRALRYARVAGLAIGLPLAVAFVASGSVAPDDPNARPVGPEITTAKAQGLDTGPSHVTDLPTTYGSAGARRGVVRVRNKTTAPLEVSASASASGSASTRYLVGIATDGKRLFAGTPSELKASGTKSFTLLANEQRELRVHVRLRDGAPAGSDGARSFELEWATRLGGP